jgi:hypothetical protein
MSFSRAGQGQRISADCMVASRVRHTRACRPGPAPARIVRRPHTVARGPRRGARPLEGGADPCACPRHRLTRYYVIICARDGASGSIRRAGIAVVCVLGGSRQPRARRGLPPGPEAGEALPHQGRHASQNTNQTQSTRTVGAAAVRASAAKVTGSFKNENTHKTTQACQMEMAAPVSYDMS